MKPQARGRPRLRVVEAPDSSLNHRPYRAARPANHRAASSETLDEPLKLASGERRILTALAQYPEGRSKVQVAVLTGYAANGGGFNNYLGGLRSRGMIQGDGDRLTITEAGIQTLGSWKPLPAGSALIDYWRGRLGKAERLILETLTQVYPAPLTKAKLPRQSRLRSEWRRFQQRSRPAENAGAGSRARRDVLGKSLRRNGRGIRPCLFASV
jgi:uncharacterized protein